MIAVGRTGLGRAFPRVGVEVVWAVMGCTTSVIYARAPDHRQHDYLMNSIHGIHCIP